MGGYLCPLGETGTDSMNPSMKSNQTIQPVTAISYAVKLLKVNLTTFIPDSRRSHIFLHNLNQASILCIRHDTDASLS